MGGHGTGLPATQLTMANSISPVVLPLSCSTSYSWIPDDSPSIFMVVSAEDWSCHSHFITLNFIDMNVIFFFFPFDNCSFAHYIRWFCLNHFPHFFRLNLHSRLKIEAESHGHWSKISAVKSQLSRRCVSTALRLCIGPFCLSGPVSYQQPGEHWQ